MGAPRWLAPVASAAAGAAAVGWIAVIDPNQPGNYPRCPFAALTGLWCPGCGTLRAVHALAHGELGAAVASNPLTVALLPVVAWLWWRWARRHVGAAPAAIANPRAINALLGLVLGFWLVRNLPIGAALAP